MSKGKSERKEVFIENVNKSKEFVQPIHKELKKELFPSSLESVGEEWLEQNLKKKLSSFKEINELDENYTTLLKENYYERLVYIDLLLKDNKSGDIISDNNLSNFLTNQFNQIGLTTIGKYFSIVYNKRKLLDNVIAMHRSYKAKQSKEPKSNSATPAQIEALEHYKFELSCWAKSKYSKACLNAGKSLIKTKSENSYDKKLFDMASKAFDIYYYGKEESSIEFDESILDEEGNVYGCPIFFGDLLDFKISTRFFYEQIKN